MTNQEHDNNDYEQYSSAVGSCIIKWNEVEIFLLFIFQKLLCTDDLGSYSVWYSYHSIRPRVSLMRNLGKNRLSDSDYKLLDALLKVIEKEAAQRNFIAHSPSMDNRLGDVRKTTMSSHPMAIQLGIAKKNNEIDIFEIREIFEDFEHLRILINSVYFSIYHNDPRPSLSSIKKRR